jgi:hypothetical protein
MIELGSYKGRCSELKMEDERLGFLKIISFEQRVSVEKSFFV